MDTPSQIRTVAFFLTFLFNPLDDLPLTFNMKIEEQMEAKGECLKREAKEREFQYGSKHTVLFTAGTAILMVGLKRVVMMFLAQQWRSWVFLILNVVLLAIFFTSVYPKSSGQNQESVNNAKGEKRMKKRNEECVYWSADDQDEACNRKKMLQRETNENEEVGMQDFDEDEADEIEPPPRLSKEELNERVEAFIATFRQHLVLDARKGREVKFFNRQQKRENGSFIKIPKRGRRYVL